MNLSELVQGLSALYPTRYSHFTTKQKPPFICYLDDGEHILFGDNEVYMTAIGIRIELYTKTKDFVAENKIKEFLNNNSTPYEKGPTIFIESEGFFLSVFEIEIID